MRKNRWYFGMAAGMTVLAMGLGGCEKEVRSAVIEEKKAEDAQIQYYEEKETESQNGKSLTLREQVNAPDIYEANFKDSQKFMENDAAANKSINVHVTSNSPVLVPDVPEVHLKKVIRKSSFDEAPVKKLLQALCDDPKEFEKSWEQKDESDYDTPDQLKMIDGKMNIGGLPYFYNYNFNDSAFSLCSDEMEFKENGYWNNETGELIKADSSDMTEEGLKEHKSDALKLIESIGYTDWQIADQNIGKIMYWTEDGEQVHYFGIYDFEQMADGIPVNYIQEEAYPYYSLAKNWESGQSYGDDNVWMQNQLSVGLTTGVLESILIFNSAEIYDYSDENQFVLPFDEIRQIFESTIVMKMAGVNGKSIQGWNGHTLYPGYDYAPEENAEITISQVKFGYMRTREKGSPTEGFLIPVWDFYGTWTLTDENGKRLEEMNEKNVSLLTINACDGTILNREFAY